MTFIHKAQRIVSASLVVLIALFGLVPTFTRADSSDVILNIPALNISTPIVEIKIKQFPNGELTWDTQYLGMNVGHLEGTAWVDAPGNIVLGAHSELANRKPGIFYELDELEIGDEIELVQDTETRQYVVSRMYEVEVTDVQPVYPTTNEQITLITCDTNSYDGSTGNYNKRLIVVAERQS
jgi:LPXTG-site transpeptidase (sortase) family protein